MVVCSAKHPEKIWMKQQRPNYRLIERRLFHRLVDWRKARRLGPHFWDMISRMYALENRNAITPLKPGEKMH